MTDHLVRVARRVQALLKDNQPADTREQLRLWADEFRRHTRRGRNVQRDRMRARRQIVGAD